MIVLKSLSIFLWCKCFYIFMLMFHKIMIHFTIISNTDSLKWNPTKVCLIFPFVFSGLYNLFLIELIAFYKYVYLFQLSFWYLIQYCNHLSFENRKEMPWPRSLIPIPFFRDMVKVESLGSNSTREKKISSDLCRSWRYIVTYLVYMEF